MKSAARCLAVILVFALGVGLHVASASQVELGLSIATFGRAGAGIADADGNDAAALNPAGLALPWAFSNNKFVNQFGYMTDIDGDVDIDAYTYRGQKAGNDWGIGAFYVDQQYADVQGVGFGKSMTNNAFGATVYQYDPSIGDETTFLDLGLSGGWAADRPWNLQYGFVIRDFSDQWDRRFDAGLAMDWPCGCECFVDVTDLGDVWDRRFRIGGTYGLGALDISAGLNEGNPTAGLTYDGGIWSAGIGWADAENSGDDDVIVGGVSLKVSF